VRITVLLGGGVEDPVLLVTREQEALGWWLIGGVDSWYNDIDAGAREWGRGGTEVTGSLGITVVVLHRLL
jgi:hypothetical protein